VYANNAPHLTVDALQWHAGDNGFYIKKFRTLLDSLNVDETPRDGKLIEIMVFLGAVMPGDMSLDWTVYVSASSLIVCFPEYFY
jgi:hypothetical protein